MIKTLITFLCISLFTLTCMLMSACDSDAQHHATQQPISDKNYNIIINESHNDLYNESNSQQLLINDPSLKFIPKNQADWAAIKSTGILRIIIPYSDQFNHFLPRKPVSYNNELETITRFAKNNSLEPIFVSIKKQANMLALLEQGYGDIVVANLTLSTHKKQQINYTLPIDHSKQQLVVAQSNNEIFNIKQLEGLKIGAPTNTLFWNTLTSIKKSSQQSFDIIKLNEFLLPDDLFKQVLSGELDAVVVDSNSMALFKEYRHDIKAVLDISNTRSIAWAVRENNPNLLKQLNDYIKTEKLTKHQTDTRIGDFDEIKKHHQLRLITRNNAATYFLWKNQLMGFEYDLIKQFAKKKKLSLQVLVAQDFEQMTKWLKEGYGDIISSGLTNTPEREQLPVSFSNPYVFVDEVVVQRKNEPAIKLLNDLDKRTFYIRKSSAYWTTLKILQKKLNHLDIHFFISFVPETMETEEIIQHVVDGLYDLTLSDTHITNIEKSWHSNLQTSLALTSQLGHRWMVRDSNQQLVAELNKFIDEEYKQLYYNVTYNKYFNNSRNLFNRDNLVENNSIISTYDTLIKSLSKEYNFDWRLIAAQVNKESSFNTKAKSWTGAIGLLQVMPKTAVQVGISNLEKPENGLRAGIKYMAWISRQLSSELPQDVHTWFTLAAYNAGIGHLRDARWLAVQEGLNPDRWFGHVEKAFLLLSKPEYHKHSRYGYVRGIEPVMYIKKIQALFKLYNNKHPNEV